jgi:hypothetical protein
MRLEVVEGLLLTKSRLKYRPLLWRTVGSFAIGPPQRFCGADIWSALRDSGDPLADHTSNSRIYSELRNLQGAELLQEQPKDGPHDKANWFIRIDQPGWDVALRLLDETL